jgi:methylthioribose-1-phosphate isomerase
MQKLGDRPLDWIDDGVSMVDQTRLPDRYEVMRIESVPDMVAAIRRLSVRGAPAIGVAGALGVALAIQAHGTSGPDFERAIRSLREARPTAVNLARMVDRVAPLAGQGLDRVLAEALAIRDEEIAASVSMGEYGADLVTELLSERSARAMTICNTGGLATIERGTALAVIQTLHERGTLAEALALETRPLLQGARYADVPFIVVAPESTVDMDTPGGDAIPIEDRDATEVVSVRDRSTAPANTDAANPAFDITPADLITAIVTDRRVVRLDRGDSLRSVPLGELRRPATD